MLEKRYVFTDEEVGGLKMVTIRGSSTARRLKRDQFKLTTNRRNNSNLMSMVLTTECSEVIPMCTFNSVLILIIQYIE